MERSYLKSQWTSKAFDVFNIAMLMLLIVVMLYPFLNQLAISLNDSADVSLFQRGNIYINNSRSLVIFVINRNEFYSWTLVFKFIPKLKTIKVH